MSSRKEKDCCRSRESRLFNGLGQNILMFYNTGTILRIISSLLHIASENTL
jgi:hypothetical protein